MSDRIERRKRPGPSLFGMSGDEALNRIRDVTFALSPHIKRNASRDASRQLAIMISLFSGPLSQTESARIAAEIMYGSTEEFFDGLKKMANVIGAPDDGIFRKPLLSMEQIHAKGWGRILAGSVSILDPGAGKDLMLTNLGMIYLAASYSIPGVEGFSLQRSQKMMQLRDFDLAFPWVETGLLKASRDFLGGNADEMKKVLWIHLLDDFIIDGCEQYKLQLDRGLDVIKMALESAQTEDEKSLMALQAAKGSENVRFLENIASSLRSLVAEYSMLKLI